MTEKDFEDYFEREVLPEIKKFPGTYSVDELYKTKMALRHAFYFGWKKGELYAAEKTTTDS